MDSINSKGPTVSGPVVPPIFPTFDWIRVRFPIVANEKTIWPGPKETHWQWVEGFPFELHPFAWDYLWIRCNGYDVEIEPHYLDSTWDTFWTNGTGHVRANAMRGLFPFTLGKQVDLLKGIVATLEALPALIQGRSPDDATKIQQIHGILKTREHATAIGPDPAENMSSLRRSVSEFIWRRKLKRIVSGSDSSRSSGDRGPRS
jgi:hypothetical protein